MLTQNIVPELIKSLIHFPRKLIVGAGQIIYIAIKSAREGSLKMFNRVILKAFMQSLEKG